MAWDRPDETTIAFECDGECGKKLSFISSDFGSCWRKVQEIGWRGFKRTGRDWSHICPDCVPAAEAVHSDHKRMEDERDRIRARNAN